MVRVEEDKFSRAVGTFFFFSNKKGDMENHEWKDETADEFIQKNHVWHFFLY